MREATINAQDQLEQIEQEAQMQRAECCEYFESHARCIYSLVVSPQRAAAAELGRHLKAGWRRQEAKFSSRDVHRRACSPELDTPERVRAAVDILVDARWLRPHGRDRNLGRPSETTPSTRAHTKSKK